jgi:hypothetical protein
MSIRQRYIAAYLNEHYPVSRDNMKHVVPVKSDSEMTAILEKYNPVASIRNSLASILAVLDNEVRAVSDMNCLDKASAVQCHITKFKALYDVYASACKSCMLRG